MPRTESGSRLDKKVIIVLGTRFIEIPLAPSGPTHTPVEVFISENGFNKTQRELQQDLKRFH